ncbi:MAG: serine acetyltransferase [Bacteroides sp.]|nr:serine acetyltransferase [Roseburia sp.]MCM1347623.1 serine acetyltransferase [Bacteroides sp.]MCM1422073.1 serine acetyltransferase [Bacteroides sp.]
MTHAECKNLILADYKRIKNILGGGNFSIFIKTVFLPQWNFIFWFRIGSYLKSKRNVLAKIALVFIKWIYNGKELQTGIQLPLGTKVGGGLIFIHYSGIVIAESSIIGRNCTILQGVTLGHSFSKKNDGTPQLGDNVVVFAGAKLLGNIKIGNRAIIAANAVVTKDVPENCIVAGQPARIIANDTSELFCDRWKKDYAR